ncbi:MAG: diphthine--ammonia ligase [Nitrososphaera sp.]
MPLGNLRLVVNFNAVRQGMRQMRLAALFSGGKDSTFAILKAIESGHSVVCLIGARPPSDESMLFHYPNAGITRYQAKAMQLPIIEFEAGSAMQPAATGEIEKQGLEIAVRKAVSEFRIEGLVSGGIASNYQRVAFQSVCDSTGLQLVSPLWQAEPLPYMRELLERHFEVMIVSVSAMGLDKSWLGVVVDAASLDRLAGFSAKYGFNLAFEGGEAETLVLDCPLFEKRLAVISSRSHWDGQRGMFEILEAALLSKNKQESKHV